MPSAHEEIFWELYNQGTEAWNSWRQENPTIWPDLRELSASRLDLRHIDFENADLLGAQFRQARLDGANLRTANLKNTNFTGASLQRADLREANLHNSNLRRSDLRGALLIDANLNAVEFEDAVLDHFLWKALNEDEGRGVDSVSTAEPQTPRVFFSYSHDSEEHKERVRALADRLRADGLDVHLDRYLPPAGPEVGWATWMELEIVDADFVLVVCTERYHEKFYDPDPSGAGWEGAVLTQQLYEQGQRNARFLPILMKGGERSHIPLMLRRSSWFSPVDEQGYLNLYRQLTNQPEVEAPAIGSVKRQPPRPDTELFADSPPPEPSFRNDHEREISTRLDNAWERHETLLASGGDTTVVMQEIVDLKRQLRSGPDLRTGDILGGRFKLLDRLGTGGFATVWRAVDKRRRELVAVKVLHGQHTGDRSRLERFFRGANKMARLEHPGIVRVIEEQAEDDGYHYFALEYAAGGDLRRAVLEGKIARDDAVQKVLAIGDALQHAHGQGCIHRDVKPANILLMKDGRAKLSDFDLVRALDTTGGTRTHAAMGSFYYSAPETLDDAGRAGVEADVYSMGMTLAFVLHGAELPRDVLRRGEEILGGLPAPESVRGALIRATNWEAEARWGSVAALTTAVRRGLRSRAV